LFSHLERLYRISCCSPRYQLRTNDNTATTLIPSKQNVRLEELASAWWLSRFRRLSIFSRSAERSTGRCHDEGTYFLTDNLSGFLAFPDDNWGVRFVGNFRFHVRIMASFAIAANRNRWNPENAALHLAFVFLGHLLVYLARNSWQRTTIVDPSTNDLGR
jgi:hypothetical protein